MSDASPQSEPMQDETPAYEIGYRRPPKSTQFKPGQSGNRKGRPKGSQNLRTVLGKELNAKVTVTENGRRKTVPKREIIAKQLVNKAATGDIKATAILLAEERVAEQVHATLNPVGAHAAPDLNPEDQRVFSGILDRIRRNLAWQPSQAGDTVSVEPPGQPDETSKDKSSSEGEGI